MNTVTARRSRHINVELIMWRRHNHFYANVTVGLLGKPVKFETPDTFRITSTNDSQSALLVVTYGLVQTSMSIHFANDDLYYTTTITMKNIGTASANNLKCKYRELFISYPYNWTCEITDFPTDLHPRCTDDRSGQWPSPTFFWSRRRCQTR